MMFKYFIRLTFVLFCIFIIHPYASALDLQEAIQRALTYSPTMAIANSEIDIMQCEECQASLLPNPELSVEIDGANSFIRSNKKNRNDDREISYSLSQLFELGGKRHARKQVAAFQTSLASYEMESVKLDIINDVTKAFVDVMAAQENIKLAEEQLRIAHEIFSTTSAKVQGGKISALQETKADLNRITASLVLEKAQRNFVLAKKKLASLWGSSCPDFTEVVYPFFEISPLEELATLLGQQSNNLEAMKWDLQIATAKKIIINEKTQRVPDVVVSAGYVSCEDDDDGLLLAFSMPIPVFDRNQGNICSAKEQLNQLYEKKAEAMIQQKIDLEDTYNQLLTSYKQGLSFKKNILTSAKTAFDAAREEYKQGKNDYLELLDGQRTLFEVQQNYIDTLVDFHYQKADIKRLVGLPITLKPSCQYCNK